MAAADRYLLTSPRADTIYPGTLAALTLAMRDAERASALVPGRHTLTALHGGARRLIRVYEAGACTWHRDAREEGYLPDGRKRE